MNKKKLNKIPHAQIKRITRNSTDKNIGRDAIIEIENFIIQEVEDWTKKAKKIMGYKKVKTLKPEFYEFSTIGDRSENIKSISYAPVKRLIKEQGIEFVNDEAVKKIIHFIVNRVNELTREASLFTEHEGMVTIKDRHIIYGKRHLN